MADHFYIALLHYPVYNKQGAVVATAVTNLDVHDIARAARTYGVEQFYIITPVASQRDLVGTILRHWQQGYGSSYNPARREAFQIACIKSSLDEVREDIVRRVGSHPKLVVTGANLSAGLITYATLRAKIREENDAYLMVFGTGWGLAAEVLMQADLLLEPIHGVADYNHLSVRSAVSIALDRLRGRVDGGKVTDS